MKNKKLENMIHKWGKPIAVVFLSTIITFVLIDKNGLMLPSTYQEFYLGKDHNYYIEIAEGINILNRAPFCWRITVPFLAGLFSDVTLGFLIITVISFIFSGVAVYLLAETFNISGPLPYVGLLLFYSIEGIQFALFDFYLPDALVFLVITFSIILIKRKNDLLLTLLLVFGVSVKESVLFLIPLVYTLRATSIFDMKNIKRTILIAIPVVLTFFIIRHLIPNENEDYNYLTLFFQVIPIHIKNFSINEYILQSFGMTIIIPFLDFNKNKELFLRFLPYFILVFSQLLFAIDTNRLLAIAFPATIVLSLNAIKNHDA